MSKANEISKLLVDLVTSSLLAINVKGLHASSWINFTKTFLSLLSIWFLDKKRKKNIGYVYLTVLPQRKRFQKENFVFGQNEVETKINKNSPKTLKQQP